jgi:GNAT-family acetyltransferase (TIGR03103 family)
VSSEERAHRRPDGYSGCNRYTQVIIDEAMQRGIDVEVIDGSRGELRLATSDRSIITIESMSELTSATALRRCDHKAVTRDVLARAGLRVAPGRLATFDDDDFAFLAEWSDIVVKPARGEQGWGITIGVTEARQLESALEAARAICPEVLLEATCDGDDVRVVVINDEVVAASLRRPPVVTGNGADTISELIVALSRAREADTGGASTIPLDDTTAAVVQHAGFTLDSVLPAGRELAVRRTANLHTGGTMRDVTDELHPELRRVARAAARAIDIPVVGVDLIVPSIADTRYTIIEANEQPGLANHEPRPTVERFVDLLFPTTRTDDMGNVSTNERRS